MRTSLAAVSFCSCLLVAQGVSAKVGGFGVRGGVGTDVNLGIAVGAGISYAFEVPFVVEVGPEIFYHHSSETSEENNNTYEEQTWLTVFAVRASILWGYDPNELGIYFVTGAGVAAALLEWEERSDDDPTANDDFEGTTAASIFNVGIGLTLGGGFDVRLDLPVLVFMGEYGGAAGFAPTLTATAGFRF